ncbi:hypothetical protein BJ875DRAFT_461418 [Amylocarpus encephaloides]|uniref:Uncharacterized protein n=1 Tax=Amylocarpus encephaloides TaxID=45428 RepID=A0A9P7YIZ3_9HELO|nr:hypothetical protein BJ875DRAFT_461418 [Amylocarpus encephaloides]
MDATLSEKLADEDSKALDAAGLATGPAGTAPRPEGCLDPSSETMIGDAVVEGDARNNIEIDAMGGLEPLALGLAVASTGTNGASTSKPRIIAPASPPNAASQSSSQPSSQPQSPRNHLRTLQEQQNRLSGSPHFEPLTDPIEVFLSQDDCSDAGADPVRLEKERRKLRGLRVSIFKQRAALRTKRMQLRRMESTKITADEEFMKFVRERMHKPTLLVQSPSAQTNSTLEDHFTALQTARNKYGPMEDEYSRSVEALDDLEFQLAQAEGRVYKGRTPRSDDLDDDLEVKDPSSENGSALSLSWTEQEDYHPLLLQYLGRLGDLDLAEERSEAIEYERKALLHDHHGEDVSDHNQALILKELLSTHTSTQIEITEIKLDIERLWVKCQEEDVEIPALDADSIPPRLRTDGDDLTEVKDIVHVSRPFSEHNHSMFPLLIPTSNAGKANHQVLITEFDEGNKSDRINRWILHGLQISPLDIDLLAQVFLDVMKVIDFTRLHTDVTSWQDRVLALWYSDGANTSADRFKQKYS